VKVEVKLFASLRQEAGWAVQSVELAEGATLGELMVHLEKLHPEVRLANRPVYAAVNQRYAQPEEQLAAGDVVALFPPVSGGMQWQTTTKKHEGYEKTDVIDGKAGADECGWCSSQVV
jgi:molybdopterin synthase catalytic subunit